MSDFAIDEVLSEDHFHIAPKGEFKGGDFVSYEIMFSGDQGKGTGFTKRKEGSPAPVAGETFDGELVQKNGKTELKKVWKQGGSSNGGSGWKPRDPRETRQIIHQHAQKVALQYATVRAYQKTLPTDFSIEDLFKIAAQFRADVEAVE